jgi:exo-beta-1,3-glucanase (GH17 family)
MKTHLTKSLISSCAQAVLLRLLLLPFAWLVSAATSHAAEASLLASTNVPIQQRPADLLCGVRRAVCYSGFRHGQHPDRGSGAVNPSDKEILEDLQLLSRHDNFGLIRLYDSQDNSQAVLRLIQDHKLKIKVVLGAWLDAEISNTNCPWLRQPISQSVLEANKLKNAREVQRAIRLATLYSNIVVAVAVGNEALVDWNDHMVPVESVIGYVRQAKKSISQPVTVADNYAWWARQGSALAKELDFVSVHTYPVWEGKDIDQAMAYTIANLQAVRDALPQGRLVITEAGWASVAKEFGPRASEEKQKRYYQDLYAWAGRMNITTFFFEAFDEDWKGETNDPLAAEKHWGLFTVDRKAKRVMHDLYPDLAPVGTAKQE